MYRAERIGVALSTGGQWERRSFFRSEIFTSAPHPTARPTRVLVALLALLILLSSVASVAPARQVYAASAPIDEWQVGNSAGDIVAGSDGKLWFNAGTQGIGSISIFGQINYFPVSSPSYNGITEGSDHNIWFIELNGSIGRLTPSGQLKEFPVATSSCHIGDLTSGPDGNIWFTCSDQIGQITLAGQVKFFSLPALTSPDFVTAGPDGNIWFTDSIGDHVGKITPSGQVTEYPLPHLDYQYGYGGADITAGPDGNLWLLEVGYIERISPTGQVKVFPINVIIAGGLRLVAGGDGALWFTAGASIGKITTDGLLTTIPVPTPKLELVSDITHGPDGNIWFTEQVFAVGYGTQPGRIGRINLGAQATVSPVKKAGCPDVAIYGARGSGQDYVSSENGMGQELHKVADEILHRLPPTFSVLQVGLPYEAASAPWGASNGILGDVSPYNQSVATGADLLVNGRSDFEGIGPLVSRCPNVQLVLLGLSQGAQVITLTLSLAPQPTPVTRRIMAVLLYGSPVRVPGEPLNVGDEEHGGVLSDPSLQPGGTGAEVPSYLWGVSQSYCLRDDPVCDSSPENLLKYQSVHLGYGHSLFALRGADFAAESVLATYGGEPSWYPAPRHYVALGDSYASGEGTNDYEPTTNVSGGDHCHRSPLAYASLLGALPDGFRACSGATSKQVINGRNGEPSQLDQLDSSVDLVTLSIGGDDLGFTSVLDACIDIFIPYNHSRSDQNCNNAIDGALNTLYHGDGNEPDLSTRLKDLLERITKKAPHARIIVVGYPQLFPPGGYSGGCNGIHQQWQDRINQAEAKMDTVIQDTVQADPVAEYLDTTDAFYGHWVCGRTANGEDVNDLQVHCPVDNGTGHRLLCSESFHPTIAGYAVLRDMLFDQIDQDVSHPLTQLLHPGQSVVLGALSGLAVKVGQAGLIVQVRWPGSDVRVTLLSPSGREINASTRASDLHHVRTLSFEAYSIDNPEPGQWKVKLYGASVRPWGEPVAIRVVQVPGTSPKGLFDNPAVQVATGVIITVLLLVLAFAIWRRRRRSTAGLRSRP